MIGLAAWRRDAPQAANPSRGWIGSVNDQGSTPELEPSGCSAGQD